MGRTGPAGHARPQPVRTCVGCRQRATKSDLLRIVLAREGDSASLVADVSGRAPGRGAHLHPTRECLALAERRRAFTRALRVEGPVDTSALRRHIEQASASTLARGSTTEKESGSSGS